MIPLICYPAKQKCIGSENGSVIARILVLGAGKIDYEENKREHLRIIEMLYILIVVVVIWFYGCVKTPRSVYYKV